MRIILLALVLASFGCQRDTGESSKATGSGSAASTAGTDLDSKDILARTTTATAVQVKHVLIGWKDLAAAYRGQMDPRAAARTEAEAAKLAREIAAQLRTKPAMLDELVKKHSEDPGSQGGVPYDVKADTPFVPEFKNLALRLNENEVGIVKTSYGYHVMMRLPPPPPDALESADMLARPLSEKPTNAHVQHVLVSWKDAPGARDPRAQARTKADADKLAKELLDKVRAGGDMAALMKEHSEDPGSKDNARVYEVTPDAPMVEPFKNLSLRLQEGEAGLVKSPFGWHVIKRVPPPPPDSLESREILAREPATDKAKVKHILLGWTDSHTEDPRGTKRTRAELEKLVKATVAKLQKGAKIEPLMAELSEDPGSAKSGEGYDATPDAGLVPPFKNLALRLKVGEVGVVKTDFGMHIIKRVE
ncbi:MAG: peptidylprolyl isomerase [Deltaproteobacteria bacterium]|nr:peptidylprolyl isomerase [Deltaproteobacteria bacterium]MDQ3297819.1 peptidyl-prolyl cis-trans isomerase [Myxococcota bacterium]